MSEPKPFASLSSSLLARKGHAKPAMRPQAFHISGDLTRPASQGEDDLGWNDMGIDAIGAQVEPVVALRPAAVPVPIHGVQVPEAVVSPVAVQQAKLTEEFAPEPAPLPESVKPIVRAAAGAKAKAAFTLRLDADRHLRLRLVCALQHRSAQQVVTHALDDFLARQPGIDAALEKPAR
jgi:hypothetical protein